VYREDEMLKGGAGDAFATATKELLVGGGGNAFLLDWKRRRWLRWRRNGKWMRKKRDALPWACIYNRGR
jgi:hypothetical protein